ncbi:MAG: septal ring lytic transglycosylase RlpA family protein [Spirochaetales bacterium]|nr:septal ring lytic transglycosylase RlpA family protein [Spirochaetales bacterium]
MTFLPSFAAGQGASGSGAATVAPGTAALSPLPAVAPAMVASWYGEPFHGRVTASGLVFDKNGFTAAHKTLPFGTVLRLTNPANGRSVLVTVTDRGPFVLGRDLDVSEAAARELGMIAAGTATLRAELAPAGAAPPGPAPRLAPAPAVPASEGGAAAEGTRWRIQVASFSDAANAARLRDELAVSGLAAVLEKAPGSPYTRVVLADLDEDAYRAAMARLDSLGHRAVLVTKTSPQ